jgi:peptide/nickel transport system substrate-binding protein
VTAIRPPLLLGFRAAAALLAGLVLAPACSTTKPRRDSLNVALPEDIHSLDPNREIEQVTDSVLANVFEPLVGFDEELQARPVLADSWEHPAPERWRLHLRRGVTFQDGVPLTPALVRDALQHIKDAPSEEAAQFLGQVREIAIGADGTVDIVTAQPRAILANLPGLYITKKNEAGDFPPLVGTGPYRLVSWKPQDRVVVERWSGYRGPAPAFREAVFMPVPDSGERLARLSSGRADIAYAVPPEAARERPGVRFLSRPGLTVYYIGLNLRDAPANPFRDVRVRRALHLGIDREAMVEKGLSRKAAVATQPVAPAVFGYDPDVPRPLYDPAQARQLLAQAGHGQGLRARLDLSTARLAVGRVLQEQLRAIGVELDLNPMDGDAVYQLATAGKSDLFLIGWDCSTGEASEFYEFCLHTPSGQYGKGNYGGYSNQEMDAIAETNANILDPRTRRRLLQKAAVIAMDDLPVLPLWVRDDVYGVRGELTFPLRADAAVRLADVRWADAR